MNQQKENYLGDGTSQNKNELRKTGLQSLKTREHVLRRDIAKKTR